MGATLPANPRLASPAIVSSQPHVRCKSSAMTEFSTLKMVKNATMVIARTEMAAALPVRKKVIGAASTPSDLPPHAPSCLSAAMGTGSPLTTNSVMTVTTMMVTVVTEPAEWKIYTYVQGHKTNDLSAAETTNAGIIFNNP